MLDITSDDIANLDDEQLRTVVARLCEAELRGRGFSASYVKWGGNQNAPDGGIDVRIALPADARIEGFIPRPMTGFQVKQQDMPTSRIMPEMRPYGAIRRSIQDLAAQSGAYIIVSSKGSTADSALTERTNAMRNAVAGVPHADALALDFYDRTCLARWVRSHECLIPWVRTLVGRPISGWKSYGSWSYDPGGEAAEYLCDETLRIHPAKRETDRGLSAGEGVQQLREELRQARRVIRLVGLSGVGKTRLVQALFDERVGVDSLDPALAIYTDMADAPNPQPIAMASHLVAAGTRAVLVIDNCEPELHHGLSQVCRQERSHCSLITIEYDIQADQPEGTDVFTLEPSSPELIQKLLRNRFASISQVDAQTIAEFSGGNARIAIALADTVARSGSVAGLTDEQLFQRLFEQRRGRDEDLYLIAQSAALVYSFEGEDISGNGTAELLQLGRLVGKTPLEMYCGVAELKDRGVVQKRGPWRAVLPPAIANRLATKALKIIPYSLIQQHVINHSSEHLMRSFSRRLRYLHSSQEAVRIAEKWIEVGGLLGNVIELDDLGRGMFESVAPVVPASVLSSLERALAGANPDNLNECKKYCNLLRALAFNQEFFDRSVAILIRILTSAEIRPESHGVKVFVSLFQMILSGTHASVEQRCSVARLLLSSPDERRRALGVLALKTMLEASHFSGVGPFEFGARQRDFGYWPRTPDEVRHWFSESLRLVVSFATADASASGLARAALAEKFRGLWTRSNNQDEIVNVCHAITNSRFWPEGWCAIRQTLNVDGMELAAADNLAKLVALESALRPNDLAQKIRAMVFLRRWWGVDLDCLDGCGPTDPMARLERTEALAQDLGKAIATDDLLLGELLPEAVASDGRLWSFGQGLAAAAANVRQLWQRLIVAFANAERGVRRFHIIQGFLQQVRVMDPPLGQTFLDEAVEAPALTEIYPFLQEGVELEATDVARLRHSITIGNAPAEAYNWLASSAATNPIRPGDFQELILAIAAMPSGFDIAVNITQARLHLHKTRDEEIPRDVTNLGSELLRRLEFTNRSHLDDWSLGEIARSCLINADDDAVAFELCRRLRSAVSDYSVSIVYYDDLLHGVLSAKPTAGLDGLCGGDQVGLEVGIGILRDIADRKKLLIPVPDYDLLAWCDLAPETRYEAMASVIGISERESGSTSLRWTPIALRFLDKAPHPGAVLRVFTSHFMRGEGLVGSNATIAQADSVLLNQLGAYPNLDATVVQEKERISKWIEEESRREYLQSRDRDERFE